MKAKASILVVLVLPLLSFAQQRDAKSPVGDSLRFDDLRPQYGKFEEIRPKLVNASRQSIYLKWTHPQGAHLLRLNEETGEWEAGAKGINCGTGLGKPVEVKAGESKAVTVEWELSTDDFKRPRLFELADHRTHRPLSGRYKLSIPYSLEVWAWGRKANRIYYLESQEFSVVWPPRT